MVRVNRIVTPDSHMPRMLAGMISDVRLRIGFIENRV